ncbi:hypothetical protein ACFL3P_03120 [Pseudomonadota bacterium]
MNTILMENKKKLRVILNNFFLMGLCVLVLDAKASDFLLESEINARLTYDDNVNFPVADGESSSIYMVTPKMKLNYLSDSWETAMNASITGTTYSAQYQDQIDSHLDLETSYKDNRSIYSIMAGYDKFSNRAADENIIGLTAEQTDTRKFTIAPEYTHLLTERLSLSLAYSYSDVTYSPNLGSFLPYETQSAIGEMVYKLSQKSDLSLVLSAMDYTSENDIVEFQLLSSKAGIVHNFSEMIVGQFFAGVNTRDITTRSSQNFVFFGSTVTGTQAVETSGTGSIFEAGVDAKWIELNASRNVAPNYTGGIEQVDKVSAKLRMQVTPLIGLVLSLKRTEIDELNDNVIDHSRLITTVIPAINFSLTRDLSLRAEYISTEQKYDSLVQGVSKKSRFAINLKYNFPSI